VLNTAAATFLISRAIYNYIYINNTTGEYMSDGSGISPMRFQVCQNTN